MLRRPTPTITLPRSCGNIWTSTGSEYWRASKVGRGPSPYPLPLRWARVCEILGDIPEMGVPGLGGAARITGGDVPQTIPNRNRVGVVPEAHGGHLIRHMVDDLAQHQGPWIFRDSGHVAVDERVKLRVHVA